MITANYCRNWSLSEKDDINTIVASVGHMFAGYSEISIENGNIIIKWNRT